VLAWTVDNPEEAKRLIALGVKGITTNRTAFLRSQSQKNKNIASMKFSKEPVSQYFLHQL